ncbi:hypothetical protein TIFTF001_015140 [Ficus carica]|uniref:Protein kinase domain-containing protein n=1 Tax=Ficus carica TaxID=3494 RepID=A0AA88D8P2_FICCA|nr:hypothetical protein TIFTF001_015140 [Ficus carica]
MVLQLVGHILLFSCLITTAASEAPTAKERCPTKCGNITIPFPFGIGTGCYINNWFEVVCTNRNNNTVPLLKRINLEVISIDEDGVLDVKLPITFWNCNDLKTPQNTATLEGSPFAFSERENKFIAVGCGVLAMISSSKFNGSIGCSAACVSEGTNNVIEGNTICDGMDCCQTSIPSNMQAFNTSFLDIRRDKSEKTCGYAFLVNHTWIRESVENISALHEMTSDVPVVLYWELYPAQMEALGKSADSFASDGIFKSEDRSKNKTDYCATYPNTLSPVNQTKMKCYCMTGFEGNPYLHNGCLDIDECVPSDDYHRCGDDEYCVNTVGSYTCKSKRKKSWVKVVLIGVGNGFGAVLLLLGSWGLFKLVKKRRKIQRKKKFFTRNGGLLLQQQLSSGEVNVEKTKLFNSKELDKATDHFNVDRILGQGGQGTVYKGMLADGKIVAIKKSKIDNEGKIIQFINEVVILSQINHRNIVKLLGCCLETEVPLLVYEFVPNGTLSKYIYDEQEEFPLTWEVRLRIATEIAGALSYLHTSASLPIYHRDIKSTNILLDGRYRAKVADFGTSRSVAIDQTHLTTLVHGTFGYLDPEYFQSSQFSDKSDVYSFGVVLVELLSGQKPISIQRSEEGRRGLATYFMQSMEENALFDIVDARVMREGKREAIIALAELAKRCLNLNGKKRPTMKEVAALLEDIKNSEKASGAHEPDVEEVEYVREVPDQPWELFSTSTCPADFGDPAGLSAIELPLFSNVTQ